MKSIHKVMICALFVLAMIGGGSKALADDGGIFSLLIGDNKIEVGTFTNGQATVTFAATFSAAPKVMCYWADAAILTKSTSSNTDPIATSITTSNFVPSVESTLAVSDVTNGVYYAIGAK